MARNQEKSQSMLYRFREAQAASLGLTPKPTRRPRLASSVTSVKECERWRGEVIREISRKVSKIQDFGLTDYEVRDLNDEINKLLREKVHWENQILSLGGANYKRAIPSMLGGPDQGMGKGGYKYFGRAKDLPGVKELFTCSSKPTSGQEHMQRYKRFRNLPGSYYGDQDEDDGMLLQEEAKGEEREWNERYLEVITGLGRDLRSRNLEQDEHDENNAMSEDDDRDMIEGGVGVGGVVIPNIPRPNPKPWKESMAAFSAFFSTSYTDPASDNLQDVAHITTTMEMTKRAQDSDQDQQQGGQGGDETTQTGSYAKRFKGQHGQPVAVSSQTFSTETTEINDNLDTTTSATPPPAAAATMAYSIFNSEDLAHPAIPDRAAMEKVILQARKKQLRQEYIGN
ncbi:related to pre-mRNA splicing factor [Melanopsichium pennsylvanicum]|uniref:Related to pre-mRNA splicing factor n=2 Tax=Melanopsichium pennsylvanicum TaxID=63383 RepID=A0AAJ5C3K3_9BASI|nr:related to pre-mRNA splicing factor [Melanopsichium pennsylvanicum 4]SNX82710.1 related to pre-mRNA splicing factor [Melanopsichium pennsylvanicum]